MRRSLQRRSDGAAVMRQDGAVRLVEAPSPTPAGFTQFGPQAPQSGSGVVVVGQPAIRIDRCRAAASICLKHLGTGWLIVPVRAERVEIEVSFTPDTSNLPRQADTKCPLQALRLPPSVAGPWEPDQPTEVDRFNSSVDAICAALQIVQPRGIVPQSFRGRSLCDAITGLRQPGLSRRPCTDICSNLT